MDKTKMPLSSITVVSKIENSQVTGLAVPSRSLMEHTVAAKLIAFNSTIRFDSHPICVQSEITLLIKSHKIRL